MWCSSFFCRNGRQGGARWGGGGEPVEDGCGGSDGPGWDEHEAGWVSWRAGMGRLKGTVIQPKRVFVSSEYGPLVLALGPGLGARPCWVCVNLNGSGGL